MLLKLSVVVAEEDAQEEELEGRPQPYSKAHTRHSHPLSTLHARHNWETLGCFSYSGILSKHV